MRLQIQHIEPVLQSFLVHRLVGVMRSAVLQIGGIRRAHVGVDMLELDRRRRRKLPGREVLLMQHTPELLIHALRPLDERPAGIVDLPGGIAVLLRGLGGGVLHRGRDALGLRNDLPHLRDRPRQLPPELNRQGVQVFGPIGEHGNLLLGPEHPCSCCSSAAISCTTCAWNVAPATSDISPAGGVAVGRTNAAASAARMGMSL